MPAFTSIVVYIWALRFVLSCVAWRLLLLLGGTFIKYAVKGTRYDTISGPINLGNYQE